MGSDCRVDQGSILAVDAALNNIGMVAARPAPGAERPFEILEWRCAHMDKAIPARARKRGGHASMSSVNAERAKWCSRALEDFAARHRASIVVVELPSGGSKSQAAAYALGMITGVIGSLADANGWTLLIVPASKAKELFAGYGEGKQAVEAGVREMYPDITWPKTKKDGEHVFDAMGALLAARDEPALCFANCM